MIWNKLLKVGRPKKTDNQISPMCKEQGFSYTNPVRIDNHTYFYIHFRHNNRTIKDHDIDRIVREKEPLKHGIEYNYLSNRFTQFDYNPYLKNFKYEPIKHTYRNEAIPIVIYNIDMMKIPIELKDKIKEIAITEKEKDWILDSNLVKTQFRVKDYYNEILNSGIVTVGHEAEKLGHKIETETEFIAIGNIRNQTDNYGMFDKILKMRDRNHKISESYKITYNVIEKEILL